MGKQKADIATPARKILKKLGIKYHSPGVEQSPKKAQKKDTGKLEGNAKRTKLETNLKAMLREKSVASKSVAAYTSTFRCFKKFAIEAGYSEEDIWPENMSTPFDNHPVLLWLVEMINEDFDAGTIASRISALKWYCETGLRKHDLDAKIVSRVMGAARRCNSQPVEKAKPVTPENIRTFRVICHHPGMPTWYKRLFVIIILCFTGFLRISECLSLRYGYITFTSTHLSLNIPDRKGDRYRLGSKVLIARLHGNKMCPVATLEEWIQKGEKKATDPIFPGCGDPTERGPAHISYTTIRKQLSTLFTDANLDLKGLRTHSFRVGGATAAHLNGVSDADAAKHGDWEDLFTFHGYLEPETEGLLKVSKSLGL